MEMIGIPQVPLLMPLVDATELLDIDKGAFKVLEASFDAGM